MTQTQAALPRHVHPDELRDPRALLFFWRHACRVGLADYSTAGMVEYFALAAHCLRVAESSPVGLLRVRLQRRDVHGINPADEDAASEIRRKLFGAEPNPKNAPKYDQPRRVGTCLGAFSLDERAS